MAIRLLLNGKKAAQEDIREAVYRLRDEGHEIEVRPTWEGGDFERLVIEASEQGCKRIIAGGGDGTINEVVDALLSHSKTDIEVAILPLGTANDFATACEIPTYEPYEALKLAVTGQAFYVDAAQANERHFINIATAGFGAQVTTNTPVALKNFLGGGAYTLSGLVQAIKFQPFKGTAKTENYTIDSNVVVGAVCNGRMAGGGQLLSPDSYIDDGLLDIFSIQEFPATDVGVVLEELSQQQEMQGSYVHRESVEKLEWESDVIMPVNLDGEPLASNKVVIKVLPGAVKLVLPARCSVLKNRVVA